MSFVTSQKAESQKWCKQDLSVSSLVFTDCQETQKTLLIGISGDVGTTSALCFGLHKEGVMFSAVHHWSLGCDLHRLSSQRRRS